MASTTVNCAGPCPQTDDAHQGPDTPDCEVVHAHGHACAPCSSHGVLARALLTRDTFNLSHKHAGRRRRPKRRHRRLRASRPRTKSSAGSQQSTCSGGKRRRGNPPLQICNRAARYIYIRLIRCRSLLMNARNVAPGPKRACFMTCCNGTQWPRPSGTDQHRDQRYIKRPRGRLEVRAWAPT